MIRKSIVLSSIPQLLPSHYKNVQGGSYPLLLGFSRMVKPTLVTPHAL